MKDVRIHVEAGVTCHVAREGPEGVPRLRPQGGRPPHRQPPSLGEVGEEGHLQEGRGGERSVQGG